MSNPKDIRPKDINGKLHGFYIKHWSTGNLRVKGNYIHGKLHGCWVGYFDTGDIRFKDYYI